MDEDMRRVKEREMLEERNERERIKRLQINDEISMGKHMKEYMVYYLDKDIKDQDADLIII